MNRILLAHAAALASAISAGAAVVATRFVVGETDPLALVFYRYVVSIICFVPVVPMLWPKERLAAAEYVKIAAFGILFFVFFPWSFNAALHYNPTAPRAEMTGVALAFCVILVAFGASAFGGGDGGSLKGDGYMLLGVFCAAVYSVFGRATLMKHGALFVTALGMVFAVSALLPVIAIEQGGLALPVFTTKGWIAVIFLGSVAGAVQFSLFMWALRWLPPTTTVLYLTLNPIAAMVLGILLLGEHLTAELVAGMALVLLGIVIGSGAWANFRKPRLNPS